MSPDIPKEARQWLAKIGRKGGRARTPAQTEQRQKAGRRYKACSRPVPSRATSRLHLFNRAGVCYGCKQPREKVAIKELDSRSSNSD